MFNNRRRAQLDVIGLVLFEVVAVWVLQRVGARPDIGLDWRDIGSWVAYTPVDQIVISVVWLLALVLAWWTLGSTLLYLLLRLRGPHVGARIAGRLAFPMIRQVVDRAVAATLVTSALMGAPAAAMAAEPAAPLVAQSQTAADPFADEGEYDPQPAGTESETDKPGGGAGGSSDEGPPGGPGKAPKPVDTPDLREQSGDDAEERPGDGGAGEERAGDAGQRPGDREAPEVRAGGEERSGADEDRASEDPSEDERSDEEDQERSRDGDRSRRGRVKGDRGRFVPGMATMPQPGGTYTVRVGDHLWKIATEVVTAHGNASSRRAVATYWAELVRVATPQLRSGDPDLIYPGETLELPPLHRMGDGS